MAESKSERVFRYAWSQTAKADICVGFLIAISTLTGGSLIFEGKVFDGSIVILVFVSLFAGVFVLYRLAFSSIGFSETQVTAVAFGVRWLSLAWEDVHKIRRVRDLETDTNEWHMLYYIQGPKATPFIGAIMFQDRISELRTLLDLLNEIAGKRQIPIVSIDREADANRPRLTKARGLRGIFPEEVERPLDKL
jgi:hypothetical protein